MTMIGHDTNGVPVKLGDTDSDGYPVGWIHPDSGLAYLDEEEYWICECSGRYFDAAGAWWRDRRGVRPDPAIFSLMAPVTMRPTVLARMLDDIAFDAFLRRLCRTPPPPGGRNTGDGGVR